MGILYMSLVTSKLKDPLGIVHWEMRKKIVFTYNTMVKEVNEPSDKFKQHYFEFVTKDTLLEQENKNNQCSGNYLVVLLSIL